MLKVLLMYSQYTSKVCADYMQLKGFQNISLEAFLFPQNSQTSFLEADFQQSTTEPPLGNEFPPEVGYIKGELTNVRGISLVSWSRHAEQKQPTHRYRKCYARH